MVSWSVKITTFIPLFLAISTISSGVFSPLPIVVCNDNTYTAIKSAQDRESGGRYIGVDLANPDFVMFAKSFGLEATRVTDYDAFGKALTNALTANGPTVIEVFLPELL